MVQANKVASLFLSAAEGKAEEYAKLVLEEFKKTNNYQKAFDRVMDEKGILSNEKALRSAVIEAVKALAVVPSAKAAPASKPTPKAAPAGETVIDGNRAWPGQGEKYIKYHLPTLERAGLTPDMYEFGIVRRDSGSLGTIYIKTKRPMTTKIINGIKNYKYTQDIDEDKNLIYMDYGKIGY